MELQNGGARERFAAICLLIAVGTWPCQGCASKRVAEHEVAVAKFAEETAALVEKTDVREPTAAPMGAAAAPVMAVGETLASDEAPPLTSPQLARAEPRAARLANAVIQGNQANFDQHVLRSDVPVLVDFYATWCGPCKKLGPALDQLAAETPQARVVKVNVDESPELAARYGVKSLPSLMVFKDGQVAAREKGLLSKARLKAMLDL